MNNHKLSFQGKPDLFITMTGMRVLQHVNKAARLGRFIDVSGIFGLGKMPAQLTLRVTMLV